MNKIKGMWEYVRGIKREVSKVKWLTKRETFNQFVVTVVFSGLVIGFFSIVDVLATMVRGWFGM